MDENADHMRVGAHLDLHTRDMPYREELPENCPPGTAAEIKESIEVFRLVRSSSPSESDFRSQRAERPERVFPGVTECQALGLSVFTDRVEIQKRLRVPKMKGRKVCRLELTAGAGHIQQTGRGSHHTWWPYSDYDILAQCNVEAT